MPSSTSARLQEVLTAGDSHQRWLRLDLHTGRRICRLDAREIHVQRQRLLVRSMEPPCKHTRGGQITYLAAMRALSDEHLVLALLNRIMREVYAIQPLAETLLFLPGAAVDQVFACTGTSAQEFTTNLYQTGGSACFQANYFTTNLESRGLVNSDIGACAYNLSLF